MSSKKKQRRSNRNVKVPMKLNDHMIGNLSSKRNNNVSEVTASEVRVTGIGESIESGVKSMGKDEIVHGKLQVDKEVSDRYGNSVVDLGRNRDSSHRHEDVAVADDRVNVSDDVSNGDREVNVGKEVSNGSKVSVVA